MGRGGRKVGMVGRGEIRVGDEVGGMCIICIVNIWDAVIFTVQ